jgi:hypothetical protein
MTLQRKIDASLVKTKWTYGSEANSGFGRLSIRLRLKVGRGNGTDRSAYRCRRCR